MHDPERRSPWAGIAALFALLAFMAACSTSQECYEPVNVNAITGFQSLTVDSVDSPISVTGSDTIYIKVPRRNFRDTLLNAARMEVLGENKAVVIGSLGYNIRLLLNPEKDSIRYTFRTDTLQQEADTITLYYSSRVHFISNNCGYTYYFTLNNINTTRNSIDSFALLNNDVTNGSSASNVILYFRR